MNYWLLALFMAPIMISAQTVNVPGTDLFNQANSLKYAQHLDRSGNYRAAANEYERVLYFHPDDSLIQADLIRCYIRSNQLSLGLQRSLGMYPAQKRMPQRIAFLHGQMLILSDDHTGLQQFLNRPEALIQPHQALFQIGHAFLEADWEGGKQLYEQNQSLPLIQHTYEPIVLKAAHLRRKSPVLATGLSLVVPGLGRVYAGQWKDGLISMLLIGSLGYTAWRNFRQDGRESALGWIYGGLAIGFYGGNLYGSWQAANRFNHAQNQQLVDEARQRLYEHF